MEIELQTIADRIALHDLVHAYARAADRRDRALMRSLFTDDAQIVVAGVDIGGLEQFLDSLDGLNKFKATLHCVSNHAVQLRSDEAEGECYCIATHLYDQNSVEWKMEWGIRYRDRYRRCQGDWKFSHRELVRVWQQHTEL